jgi:multicomponent Na+:H+ antiporter subunit C
MLSTIAEHFNYVVVIILMMTGLYVVFASNNMIKKLAGLSVFQTSVFLLYITIGKVSGAVPPIIAKSYDDHGGGHGADHGASSVDAHHDAYGHGIEKAADAAQALYSNPLPHVLILTAIVVGVATLAVGLALVVRIREVYGTIEEEEIDAINHRFNLEGAEDPLQQNSGAAS